MKIKVENRLCEVSGQQIVVDVEKEVTKCHYNIYYDIGESILLLFKYVFIKFRKEIKI